MVPKPFADPFPKPILEGKFMLHEKVASNAINFVSLYGTILGPSN
jgi:hypothetical protein